MLRTCDKLTPYALSTVISLATIVALKLMSLFSLNLTLIDEFIVNTLYSSFERFTSSIPVNVFVVEATGTPWAEKGLYCHLLISSNSFVLYT